MDSPVELSDNSSNGFLAPFSGLSQVLCSGVEDLRVSFALDLQEVLTEVNLPSPKGPPLTQSLAGEMYVSQWLVAYGSFSAW